MGLAHKSFGPHKAYLLKIGKSIVVLKNLRLLKVINKKLRIQKKKSMFIVDPTLKIFIFENFR